ncbi:hypothetical protein [Nocardia cyriacigeorgica]|uniref:hypothetical protein n=1 Tax=Nocardia cyriacigeorgica TaxID=135487 RepID=UPI0024558CD1|nr:hypothetical protein [Nocardia cyriacigeorgica]
MNTTTKFAGFALGLAAVFGIALGVGAAVGPEPSEPAGHDAHAARYPPTPGSRCAPLPGGRGMTLGPALGEDTADLLNL